jgi:O-6-methylguanine DNA methyltransferase
MKTDLATGWRRTPVGVVRFAVEDDGAVVALAFDEQWGPLVGRLGDRSGSVALSPSRAADPVGEALECYLAGDLSAFGALRVAPRGTEFQARVWTALRAILPGTTCSYAGIARALGAPRSARAVGAANGANPVSIIVPCHRVIGESGSLTGYAGGVERKAWLLAHEAAAPGFLPTVVELIPRRLAPEPSPSGGAVGRP